MWGHRKNVAFLSHFFVPFLGLNATKGSPVRSFYLNHGLLYGIFFPTMTEECRQRSVYICIILKYNIL